MLILMDPPKTFNSVITKLLINMLPETNSFSDNRKNKTGKDCWVNKFISLLFQAVACNLTCKLISFI